MRLQALRSILSYAWRAQTIYDVHAPLAYGFLGQVVEDDRHFYALDRIAELRRGLERDRTVVEREDHGAGSRAGPATATTVAQIARRSSTPPRFGAYLHKAVDFAGAKRVLELGTNLGLGTAYLASALPRDGRLITIDADGQVLAKAREMVAAAAPQAEVEFVRGTFAEQLPRALERMGGVDLAFLDGHHADGPTREYFAAVSEHRHDSTVVILDDIHWSPGMEAAWAWVRARPEVTLTIDLGRWGVVFFDPGVRTARHLTIVPRRYKPWHMGFFAAPRAQAG